MTIRTSGPIDLSRALSGQPSTFAPKDAVYELARSGAAGARERLAALVREEREVETRRRAAFGLSLVADARPALLEVVAQVSEPTVLAAALLSLARVGVAEDSGTIREAATRLTGHPAEQARFAALLLAHRLGLGPEATPPIVTPVDGYVPDRTSGIVQGSSEDAQDAWSRFVPNAHLGFEPDPRRCAVVQCASRKILLIPSIELAREIASRVLKGRMIVGATAIYERESATWRHDLWILSTPVSAGVELQAWTLGGRPCYAGPGRPEGEGLAFELRTTASSRLAIAHVSGRLTMDSLVIEGTVGDRVPSDSRRPALRRRPQ